MEKIIKAVLHQLQYEIHILPIFRPLTNQTIKKKKKRRFYSENGSKTGLNVSWNIRPENVSRERKG